MDLPFHLLDVFTKHCFGGNQLAVLPEPGELASGVMQAIARELNLAETVFVLPAERAGALCRLRIFTPTRELPFAGHPTIGTACLLAELGRMPMSGETAEFALEEGVGLVLVSVRRAAGKPTFARLTTATLPEARPAAADRTTLARMLGLTPAELAPAPDDPEAVSCGVPFLFVAVRDRATLARVRFDAGVWRSALAGSWAPQVFVFCRDPELAGSDLRARMFASEIGIVEDPATGAAAAALAGYLAPRTPGGAGTLKWTVEQGFEMGRPSLLQVECDVDQGAIRAVRVGGFAVRVGEGVLRLP